MRSEHRFNHNWLYAAEQLSLNAPDADFQTVTIPHTNKILPSHNFHDEEYQFISTYRKHFTLPEPREGRRVYLRFEGIMTAATVTINGHIFEEQRGGFVPFEYDITDYLNDDAENVVQVSVDSRERADIPPHGGQVDYLVFGGIYRNISLIYVEPVHIANMRVRTYDVLTGNPHVEIDVWVRNQSDTRHDVTVIGGLEHWRDEIKSVTVAPHDTMKATLYSDLRDMPSNSLKLWSVTNPRLYDFTVSVVDDDTAMSADEIRYDEQTARAGFREAEFREDGFYLNGEKLFLRGLNRHQMYPFIGMAAPERLQARDADIIKSMGCNIVRCSHYPQHTAFLDRCDEIGLLVFEEIPGWQHIGNEDWKQLSLRDVRVMIERDWNHPSIILWGVRINESWDDDDFYERTNRLAHDLDPTRQTSGVRFWPESNLLEDVYGYNDFSNGVIEPTESPWLITEFNGHMYPTKTFDNEERQMEHMRRHAEIQARAMQMGGVSGAIGWCAFDYNTHLDFGSGDRVCYHGVMDMWRQPKWAAYVYRSQTSPDDEIVLQAATFWTMGDRAGGGNDPLYVMTNCDAVDVYVGDEKHGRFDPAHDDFPGLPHPPVKVTGLGLHWGGEFAPLRIVGMRNGEEITEQRISADGVPQTLDVALEDETICADGIDMTRLVVRITDEYGNRLPYATQVIQATLDGEAELIGENPMALVGGQAAWFVKAGQQAGDVTITVSTSRLDSQTVTLSLV